MLMDPLSHLLSLYPVRTALDVRCRFGAPWVLDHEGTPRGVAPYHLIVRGEAQAEGQTLQTGDIIVFAGEAVRSSKEEYATAHGAWLSGEDAARSILEAME